ncbi:MAG: dienelactone hydrolase family protein [Candidatus Omnitrophota bacterium]|nr:dienelactone hydrolase family protein [Candidatus Omnitrophota bacterium]
MEHVRVLEQLFRCRFVDLEREDPKKLEMAGEFMDPEHVVIQHTQKGFFAVPKRRMGTLTMIVLHDHTGLTAQLKVFCCLLARRGIIAYAPDLFSDPLMDEGPKNVRRLALYSMGPQGVQMVKHIFQYLGTFPFIKKDRIGVVGFQLGGTLGLWAAAHLPNIKAIISFDGGFPTESSRVTELTCPFLYFAGVERGLTDQAALDHKKKEATQLSLQGEYYQCPKEAGSFFGEIYPLFYTPGKAHATWEDLMRFLKRTFGLEHLILADEEINVRKLWAKRVIAAILIVVAVLFSYVAVTYDFSHLLEVHRKNRGTQKIQVYDPKAMAWKDRRLNDEEWKKEKALRAANAVLRKK